MIQSFAQSLTRISLLALTTFCLVACNGNQLPNGNEDALCPAAPTNVQLVDIRSIVDWVNAMDKPLTLSCFVESLPRPLKINLSDNLISAQPALGPRSPRVFIFYDKLILSIATDILVKNEGIPAELQEHLLEFSYVTDWENAISIKGELAFPILDTLNEEDAYKRVLPSPPLVLPLNNCNVCHRNEAQVDTIGDTPVFESDVLKSLPGLSIADLERESSLCNKSEEPYRCSMHSSLLDHGPLEWAEFPENATTRSK